MEKRIGNEDGLPGREARRMLGCGEHPEQQADRLHLEFMAYDALTMDHLLGMDRQYYLLVPWRFIRQSLGRLYLLAALLLFVMAVHHVGGCFLLPAYGILFYKHYLFTLRMRSVNLAPVKFWGLLAAFMLLFFLLCRAVLCLLGWNLY